MKFTTADMDSLLAEGEIAVFSHAGASPGTTIRVIITDIGLVTTDVMNRHITAQCKGSDVSDWTPGDTITIGGVTYSITSEEEGHTAEMPVLILSKDAIQ